jgi:hypothetical protein
MLGLGWRRREGLVDGEPIIDDAMTRFRFVLSSLMEPAIASRYVLCLMLLPDFRHRLDTIGYER